MTNPEILRWFHYEHLPEPLRSISEKFHALAHEVVEESRARKANTAAELMELRVGLRKLLEAKDCLVRAQRAAIGGEPKKQSKVHKE